MRVPVRHDEVADTVTRLALTVKAFEPELDTLDSEATRRLITANSISMATADTATRLWH